MNKINTFHIGPQKSGTTWLYSALIEHEDVISSPKDSIHYMNIFYHKGEGWFHRHFKSFDKKVILDPTPSYIRHESVPGRIYKYNPKAKIMLTARNPLERAFSHYWHEKKKDRFNFTFDEIFKNYDLFTNWIEPGMYAMHYNRFLEFFPKEQIKILFFEDLNDNPKRFLEEVCEFCEINSSFMPSVIDRKINKAGAFKSNKKRQREQQLLNMPFSRFFYQVKNKIIPNDYREKLEDVSREVKNEVIDVLHEDICEFELITGRDLSKWKEKF